MAHCELQHSQQQIVLTLEKMVQAAWVKASFAGDGGDIRGVEALLVEQLKGRPQNPLARIGHEGRVLSVH